jgi:hypothetical protein
VHDARFITDWSMAISPDGREIVWAQIDARESDLMLVENFRNDGIAIDAYVLQVTTIWRSASAGSS